MAKIRTISDQEEATLDVLYNLKIIQTIKKMICHHEFRRKKCVVKRTNFQKRCVSYYYHYLIFVLCKFSKADKHDNLGTKKVY